jgi:TonB family protein
MSAIHHPKTTSPVSRLHRHLNGIWLMKSIRFTLSRMRRRSLILMLAFASAGLLSSPVLENSLAHASANSDAAQSGVVLANLSRPVYPLLARRTWVSGDVNLLLQIRRDGSVESAVIVSGHPLLQQAALESAQQSQFECRGCTEAVIPYSLVYTFQLFGKDCHATTNGPSSNVEKDAKPRAQVSQSQNHVSVLDEGGICEGVFTHKVRSAKCLYLWKCGWHT